MGTVMKFQTVALLLIVALVEVSTFVDIDTIFNSPSITEDQLYHNIAVENYDLAFTLLNEFINSGQSSVIKSVVDKSIEHRTTNVLTFAYKLYEAGLEEVVVDHFPSPFKMVFNDSLIKITNIGSNLPIRYSRFENSDGDKDVYGKEDNAGSNSYVWKLEPVVDGKNIYFKIRHFSDSWYLNLGSDMDSDGEHQAYGSTNSDTTRHQWLFVPMMHNDELLFCIINRAYYQALKFGNSMTSGSPRVYSALTNFYNYPEVYGWRIDVL